VNGRAAHSSARVALAGEAGDAGVAGAASDTPFSSLITVTSPDLSNSIFDAGAVDAVIDGAKAFVDETLTKPRAS
jgi:hypothetical protein